MYKVEKEYYFKITGKIQLKGQLTKFETKSMVQFKTHYFTFSLLSNANHCSNLNRLSDAFTRYIDKKNS